MTETNSFSCILCGHAEAPSEILSHSLRDEDSGRFSVAMCSGCGHVQITPLPSEEEEAAYYAKDMQPKALWKDGDYYDIVCERAKVETDRRLAWLGAEKSPSDAGQVLDVGSGYGFFVNALVEAGYDAGGLEVSKDRLKLARERMGGNFVEGEADGDFDQDNAGRFGVVTAFHVIEHLRDPVSYLTRLTRLVVKGGRMLIEVPNLADSLVGQIPEYAQHQWQIAHLNYFDGPHLETALEKAGVKDFTVEGVQRYGLRHLVIWTDTRAPDLEGGTPENSSPLLEHMESLYKAERERDMTCDTLIATIRL